MKNIMIIEDDRDIRDSLRELLETEGYQVSEAENGHDAITQLRASETTPGLILLDLMMPITDGPTFRKLQLEDSRLSGIPVVVTSADPRAEERMGFSAVQAFLRKPADLEDFLDTVRRFA